MELTEKQKRLFCESCDGRLGKYYCLRPIVSSVRDKHQAFKDNFYLLLGHEWKAVDCWPIEYTKNAIGAEKCICTQKITNCLKIEHKLTGYIFQVGVVCWAKKTDGLHNQRVAELKKQYEYLEKERLRLLLPICVKCKKHKIILNNEACQSCQPRNGCLIIDYEEDY